MPDSLNQDMLGLATRLATEAASIARKPWKDAGARRKADASVVTDVDHAIQAHILKAIAEAYPDHAVRAEETVPEPTVHADPASARYCWVVDPLDGTRNYVSEFPFFGTSIAVLDRGRPVVGVISEHNLGHLYATVLGGGATLNHESIHVNEPAQGDDWLLGIPSSKDAFTVSVLRSWAGTTGFILRNVGSTAVHLAMVASGTLVGAFAKRSKIWDIAAGVLLINEAGGVITDPDGSDLFPLTLDADPSVDIPFLAATPGVHGRLLETIQTANR